MKDYQSGYYRRNRDRIVIKRKEWYRNNSALVRTRQRELNQKMRIEVLTHYGGGKLACVRCGFSDRRTLTIDHIDGGGYTDKKGVDLYRRLKKQGYPEGFQTLCMNCQWIKRVENKEYKQSIP